MATKVACNDQTALMGVHLQHCVLLWTARLDKKYWQIRRR